MSVYRGIYMIDNVLPIKQNKHLNSDEGNTARLCPLDTLELLHFCKVHWSLDCESYPYNCFANWTLSKDIKKINIEELDEVRSTGKNSKCLGTDCLTLE